jgi:hypothetical protein
MQLPVIHVHGLHNEQREKPKPSAHAGKAAFDNPIHNPRKSFAVSEWLPLAGVRIWHTLSDTGGELQNGA